LGRGTRVHINLSEAELRAVSDVHVVIEYTSWRGSWRTSWFDSDWRSRASPQPSWPAWQV